MKRFSFIFFLFVACHASTLAFAQENAEVNTQANTSEAKTEAAPVDWKALGRPLDNDIKPMVDRYVYFNDITTDKQIDISKPVLAPNDIVEWMTQRVAEGLTLAAHDYDTKTITNQRHFTPKGYGQYIASLNAAQLPDVIKNKRYKVSSVVLEPPLITAKGLRDEPIDPKNPDKGNQKIYVWQVTTPVVLGYQGLNITDSKTYQISLKTEIVRIPMKEDNTLIAINGWRLEEYKPALDLKPAAE